MRLAGPILLSAALLSGGPVPAADRIPGQAAAERLGTSPVDLEKPPQLDPDTDALDELGPLSDGPASAILRSMNLKPLADMTAPVTDDGADAQPLSIEEAVYLGLENNHGLRVEQLGPVVAGTFEEIERAVFDPAVFAEAQLAKESVTQVDRGIQQSFSVTGIDRRLSLGVRQTLPTGTDLELSLSENRSDSTRTLTQHQLRAGLTLTQALLRGAGLQANLARVRQAEVDSLISVYELRGFTENLVASIETTYWDYVLARRRIEIVTTALEVAEQQLNETRKRIQVGQLPETELAAARAEAALREQALINARSRQEQLRLALLQRLNLRSESGWSRQLAATSSPEIGPVPLEDIDDHLALALSLRPELNQARLQVERGRLQVVQTRNGLLPRLDLFLTLGKSGFSDSFGQAAGNINEDSFDALAGVQFELPVFNRAADARHRAALVSREQAGISLTNLAQLVALDVRNAYLEVQRSRDQIAASTATRELQEEVLRVERIRFRVGNGTAFSVAQAQRDYVESQLGEVEARVAYRQALIELYRLEGSLLERRGIQIPGNEMVNALNQ